MDSNIESLQDWKLKLNKYLAHVTQKLTRGGSTRRACKLKLWVRYNHAAFLIQWCYRNWRNKCQMRALPLRAAYFANMTEKSPVVKPRESIIAPRDTSGEDLTQKIVRNKATYEEIMTVWRYVIELRRGFPQCSTDVLLKALIDARCDFNRAAVLVGNAEFVIRNDADLPKHIRAQFLPLGKHIVTKEASIATYERKKGRRRACKKGDEEVAPVWSNTVDAIRALRQNNANNAEEAKATAKDNLMLSTVNKSYYSVHHVGGPAGTKFYEHMLADNSESRLELAHGSE